MTEPTLPAGAPPAYDESQTTMAVTVSFAALSTCAGLLNVISSARVEMTAGLILLVGGNFAALATYVLLRRGFPEAAGLVIMTACGAITTALMIFGYGLHDVSVVGYPLVVLISGLVLRRSAHVLSLIVCLGGLGLVAYLEAKGVIATPFDAPNLAIDLVSILMVLAAVSVLVRMLVAGFRQALGRALASESALALSNRELEARALRLEAQERERILLISDLEAKNAELERFTYTVSHDLKSPLITVRAYLDSIDKDLEEGRHERIREDVHRVSAASDKMRALLDGLLKLSRVGPWPRKRWTSPPAGSPPAD
jgi:signal transduction histidine kinase